jgi:hypothetical protein
MLRLSSTVCLYAVLASTILPTALAGAQESVEREFPKASAQLKDGLKTVRSVHELGDGRVLVLDGLAQKLVVADLTKGTVETRMTQGPDDDNFRALGALWRWPGDSVAALDVGKARLTILGPDGAYARAIPVGEPLRQGTAPGAAGGSATGGVAAAPRGPRFPQLRYLVDPTTAIGTGFPPRVQTSATAAPPRVAYPVVRFSLQTLTYDTIVQLMPAQAPKAPVPGSGMSTLTVHVGTTPLQAVDAWTVLRDGTVAVVRASPYRVERIGPDGTRVRSEPIPFASVAVSGNDRKRIVEDYKKGTQTMLQNMPRRPSDQIVLYEEPSSWPTTHPPFRSDITPLVDPNDRIWVATRCARDEQALCYDVLTRDGVRADRFRLPPRTRVVGFGAEAVYTANDAKDDRHVLQRHPMP